MTSKENLAKKAAKSLGSDELLYRAVEQLASIALRAKTLSEYYVISSTEKRDFTHEESKEIGGIINQLFTDTRKMNVMPILSMLIVNSAAAAKSKHAHGATLAVSKKNKMITLKMHYGPGKDDYNDILIDAEVAKQLREGLEQGIGMIEPAKKFIMPNSGIIQ